MGPLAFSVVFWSYPVAFGLVALVANSYEVLYKPAETTIKAINRRRAARADKSLLLLHGVIVLLFVSQIF